MPVAAQILAGIAAAIHVFFFYLESVAFTKKPSVAKTFGSNSPEETEILKGIFLNQGFYNLFLAIGVVAGLIFVGWGTTQHSFWVTSVGTDVFGTTPDPAAFAKALQHSDTALPTGSHSWGAPIVTFSLACMLGASLVLLISSKGQMLRGALIQGLVPLVALVVIAVS